MRAVRVGRGPRQRPPEYDDPRNIEGRAVSSRLRELDALPPKAGDPLRLKLRLRRWLGDRVAYGLDGFSDQLNRINVLGDGWRELPDEAIGEKLLRLRARDRDSLADGDGFVEEFFALVREAAHRTIGLRPYDEQIAAGLAMWSGSVIEMPTGEGKTLAAVAPAALAALTGRGVHVLTFNDYLARRDAAWMGPVYAMLGLEVGSVQEGMALEDRRRAYDCDVTYLTAKEAGFDFLRSFLCLETEELLRREADFALVDEADSILIDEARVPLVIAGAVEAGSNSVEITSVLARQLRPGLDFDTDEYGHNIFLTEAGSVRVEEILGRGDLYDTANLELLADLRNSLHALHLLERDRDYIVRRDRVELVDDFTGRVAEDRQWPDGLQAAIEAKERLELQEEGRILGSITMHHFLRSYPRLCGMTATASSSADELDDFYDLPVVVVPSHRTCVRVDHDDVVFTHREAKRRVLIDEITRVHHTGRPILVGTASVAESEELAAELDRSGVSCRVLNAKNDELEAKVIADAGAPGAVTISTNMAGRGTDIKLAQGVAERGGLHVIATERHEARRIDRQLFGRCGRQGDPGSCEELASLEDDLARTQLSRWSRHLAALLLRSSGDSAQSLAGLLLVRSQRKAQKTSARMRVQMQKMDEYLGDVLAFTGRLE